MILARLSGVDLDEVYPDKDGVNGYTAGDNPLGKIPALDSQRQTPLLPADGQERFIQLWQHALGDGLSDAVYNYRVETMRPPELHWDDMIKRHEQAIQNSVATLDKISPWLGADWSYGNIAIICGLDYASYRAGHFDWKAAAPKLADWHSTFAKTKVWADTNAYDESAA